MELNELKNEINTALNKQLISSRILLHNFRLIDENSRKSGAYQDSRYIPFYYHLGKHISPKSVLEIGFRLGLNSGTFFKSCKTVEHFLSFQPKEEGFYSENLAKANVKDSYRGELDFHLGQIEDVSFESKLSKREWDLALINEEKGYDEHRRYLDMIWPFVKLGGYVVKDFVTSHKPAKTAFIDFCKIVDRKPIMFETRYGVGTIQK